VDVIYIITAALGMLAMLELFIIINSLRYTRQLLRIKDRHEAELRRAHKKLKSVDKLKTEFMNMAAHELKTPLTPMVGYLQLIDKNRLTSDDRENFEIAVRNTRRLQRLVDDILDIAKLESRVMKFSWEEVDFTRVIGDCVASATPSAQEKGIYLRAMVPRRLPLVRGDFMRLSQVLTNLLSNAIKFTDEGGVTVRAKRSGDRIVVEVRDTGIGISEKDQRKLFKKFYQTEAGKKKHGGTGLGLAICKQIIKYHGGKIWVRSKFGKGSTFAFSLPVKRK
jgi:signal transduction histidine kinase